MAMQKYENFRFSDTSLTIIDHANGIISDYVAQGFRLTLRQVYYQFVARDLFTARYRWTGSKWVPDANGTINAEPNYKMLGELMNKARLAGLMDWEAIEDRTRHFARRSHWESGKSILQSVAEQFYMDMWDNQPWRVFVIIEKEALVGVVEPTCNKFDVPVLAARGYPSASVLREFVVSDILPTIVDYGQEALIIHLGDHDPSGLDMTRDLQDRINLFAEGNTVELVRIALNMDQIEARKPPPNPAKTTDSRFEEYRRQFGSESWELDALPPVFIADLVETEIDKYRDRELWDTKVEEVEAVRTKLASVAARFRA